MAQARSARHESLGDLTAREIAQRLKTRWPDVETTCIRIRHWTQLGFLSASNARFPGRGKQREYQADTVVNVAVLGAIADLGIPLVGQPPQFLHMGLSRAGIAYDDWLKARTRQFYLVITHIANKSGIGATPEIREGKPTDEFPRGALTIGPVGEATIAINLSQLFSRIRRDS
jgi:hypothetical protein